MYTHQHHAGIGRCEQHAGKGLHAAMLWTDADFCEDKMRKQKTRTCLHYVQRLGR